MILPGIIGRERIIDRRYRLHHQPKAVAPNVYPAINFATIRQANDAWYALTTLRETPTMFTMDMMIRTGL